MKDIVHSFKEFSWQMKINIVIGLIGKILVYAGFIMFINSFFPRFFTETERMWIVILCIGYILNNWALNEFKDYKKSIGY